MKSIPDWLYAAVLSFLLLGITFAIQGNIGINLADEGYLWYGAIQTSVGEVPFLDFQSYDPGRYYWVALWFKLFGNTDLLTLRFAVLLFQMLGLTCALLVVRRATKSWGYLLIIGVLLILWVFPRHKMFDISICMIAVYMVSLLLEKPKPSQYLYSGITIGLAAFFGSNHGLYILLSFAFACLYIFFKLDRTNAVKKIGNLIIGIFIGYSPMLLMFIFIPGFFSSFITMIMWLFRLGNTNIPLPIPWPWRVDFAHLAASDIISGLIVGCLFLVLLLFPAGWVVRRFVTKKANLLLAATVFVGIPYAYVAFSRADIGHLAQGIPPLLLGISFWAVEYFKFSRPKFYAFMTAMLLVSCLSVGRFQPLYQQIKAAPNPYEKLILTNNEIWVDASSAYYIRAVENTKNHDLKQGESLFIAPHTPALYPILNHKSPLWDIYMLFPETEDKQRKQIEELKAKNTALVILGDIALDGRDDMRFRNTHPILWEYLGSNYKPIAAEGMPPNYTVLRRLDR